MEALVQQIDEFRVGAAHSTDRLEAGFSSRPCVFLAAAIGTLVGVPKPLQEGLVKRLRWLGYCQLEVAMEVLDLAMVREHLVE